MTIFEQRHYRDPLDVLLAAESMTCKGCIHAKIMFEKKYCSKGKKFGKRCKKYEVKET